MCLSAALSPMEYMPYIKLNVYITIFRRGALISIAKKIIKSYFSFISKANLHSFLKWAVLAILLPEGMPDLCFPQIYYVFWKRYLTLHAVAEYE